MTAAGADLNLLYGVLALQMDFITREQLLAAMEAWVFDKQQSLGAMLCRQGVLTDARHQLLSALVREHIQQHNDNPQQSLASLDASMSAWQELAHLTDPDVQASVALLTADTVHAGAADPYATLGGQFTVSQRFRILRPHASGGLGVVSVAEDTEIPREVALKEIKAGAANNPVARARFVREAEITGGLEHPGIVPVYGLGYYSDGRPYYAMKFVKGDSLKAALENFHERRKQGEVGFDSVEFRQLLQRFIDVCQAIQYAHDRGVLHRDLKPSNIMLGDYGETLVVDWGLAKPLGERDATKTLSASGEKPVVPRTSLSGTTDGQTVIGSALGTPQYMSPEQAAGRSDELSAATDIYALGATLYHMLAACPPVEGVDVAEIMEQVREHRVPPPRSRVPAIPLALQTICLTALSKEPGQRYASARLLAEDIEHWLADEPIAAAPDRPLERAARMMRKHRGVVTTTMAALLLFAVGAVAAGAAINQQRVLAEDLAEKNGILAIQKEQLAEQEKHERQKAEAALKDRDETLVRMSRDAEGAFALETVLQRLNDDPALSEVRTLLSKRTLHDLEFVERKRVEGLSPRLEAVKGHLQLQLTQLAPNDRERFDWAGKAIETLTSAASKSPDDVQLTLWLSDAYNLRGQSVSGAQQRQDFEHCLKLRSQLLEKVASMPADEAREIRRKALSIRHNLALGTAADPGQVDSPVVDLPILQQVHRERLELYQQEPTDPAIARDAGDSELTLARFENIDDGKRRAHFRRAIQFYREANATYPSAATRARWFEAIRGKLDAELAGSDWKSAQTTSDEMLAITIHVLRTDQLRDLVARGLFCAGAVAFEAWRLNPASDRDRIVAGEHCRLAVRLYEELVASPAPPSRYWYDLAAACLLEAQLLEGDPASRPTALTRYQRARGALEHLRTVDPQRFNEGATQEMYGEVLSRMRALASPAKTG